MQNVLKILRGTLAVATVGVVILLCWHCLDIYLIGNRPENIEAGVYISQVYTAEIAAERLASAAPALAVYALLAVATCVAQLIWGKPISTAVKSGRYTPRMQPGKAQSIARIVIVSLAVLFIVLGVMNGGARDVLVKAINICTECIGLG